MMFTCLSEQEIRERYNRAEDKDAILHVLADLTCSRPKEVAALLGVRWPIRGAKDFDEDLAMNLFEQGRSDKEIANACGVYTYSIQRWRLDIGLLRRKQYDTNVFAAAYHQGKTDEEISTLTGASVSKIKKWRQGEKLPAHNDRRERKKKKGNPA